MSGEINVGSGPRIAWLFGVVFSYEIATSEVIPDYFEFVTHIRTSMRIRNHGRNEYDG